MLELSIIGVSMFIGYKYMNHLTETQPNKQQISKWNMLYATLGSVFGLLAFASNGLLSIFFGMCMGIMFSCIINNAIYQFKVK